MYEKMRVFLVDLNFLLSHMNGKSSELFSILLAKMTFPFSSTCDNGCYIIIANSGYENTNEI